MTSHPGHRIAQVTPRPAAGMSSVGGAVLGFVTALSGRRGVVGCTANVEVVAEILIRLATRSDSAR